MPVRAAREHVSSPGHPSQTTCRRANRRAGTGARPLRHCMTLVGTGPRACPSCARTRFVARSSVPNNLPSRNGRAGTGHGGPARGRHRRAGHVRGTAGRHGGTAPTALHGTRRDWPPCLSGLRANMFRCPVIRCQTPTVREAPRRALGVMLSIGDRLRWPGGSYTNSGLVSSLPGARFAPGGLGTLGCTAFPAPPLAA